MTRSAQCGTRTRCWGPPGAGAPSPFGAKIFRTRLGNLRKILTSRAQDSKRIRLSACQNWQGVLAALRYSDTRVSLVGRGVSSFEPREPGTVHGLMLTLEAHHEVGPRLTLGGIVRHATKKHPGGGDRQRLARLYPGRCLH